MLLRKHFIGSTILNGLSVLAFIVIAKEHFATGKGRDLTAKERTRKHPHRGIKLSFYSYKLFVRTIVTSKNVIFSPFRVSTISRSGLAHFTAFIRERK